MQASPNWPLEKGVRRWNQPRGHQGQGRRRLSQCRKQSFPCSLWRGAWWSGCPLTAQEPKSGAETSTACEETDPHLSRFARGLVTPWGTRPEESGPEGQVQLLELLSQAGWDCYFFLSSIY